MKKICLLITKKPHSVEEANYTFGLSNIAKEQNMNVTVYLMGNGVYCSKKNQKGIIGDFIKNSLNQHIKIIASAKDLRDRSISNNQVESIIEIIDDFEGSFIEEIMENADKVISW